MEVYLPYSVALVPEVIDAIRSKGYTFATVSDCLDNGIPPYADDDTDGTDDPDNTDDGSGDDGGDQKDGEPDDGNDTYDGTTNNTLDNSGNPISMNPTVSQKNSAKSSHGSANGIVASVNEAGNTTKTDNAKNEVDESGVAAAIAPQAIIIIILSTMLVKMFAL